MNCDEFRSAVLAGDETTASGEHEASCAGCRSHARELRVAREALADPTVWEEPSSELERELDSLIARASGRAAPEPVSSPPSRTVVVLTAAAVLIAVVAGVFAVTRSPAPDWEVAVPGTDLAPTANATVQGWNEIGGTRMTLAIEGLDPAPAGFMYEFWLSDGPIHISAGTFRSSGDIELWSGVARAAFPRLWITLEPIDEDESPSGQTVLDTDVADA